MSKRGVTLYIEDIKMAVKKIETYTKGLSFDDFATDQKTADAVIRNLGVIGEAAQNIPQEIKAKHPDIPWRQIIGMRNKVIHEYSGINEEILWETVRHDIPELKRRIKELRIP